MVTPYIQWRLSAIYAPLREVRERMKAEAEQGGIQPPAPADADAPGDPAAGSGVQEAGRRSALRGRQSRMAHRP